MKKSSAIIAILFLVLAALIIPQVFKATYAPLPTATVHVWNISPTIGHNPDHTVEDTGGITLHVATTANPQTIVTTIDNTFHPEGPCGLIFWNPATNFFKWYGIANGFTAGDDLNRNAPAFIGPAGTLFGAPTFQPGDVWVTVNNPGFGVIVPLYVNFKGSDNFRFYSATSSNGVRVDQATGRVYFTSVTSGTISRLDPATNAVTTWSIGGSPHYLAIDSSGRVYSAVATAGVAGGVDAIVRIDPTATSGGVTSWAVPGGGLLSGLSEDTPDGLNFDSAGNLWFTMASSTFVGRLNPINGEISKFTTTGVSNPQLIASTGSGALLQSFFTEGVGNAASIVTPTGAVPASDTLVTPSSTTVMPTASTASFTDSIRHPLTTTITPLVVTVPGVGGTGGIVRFPMPTPSGGDASAPNHPSGMTGVVVPNTVFGSYLAPGEPKTPNSAVFQVTSPVIVPPPPPPPTRETVAKSFTLLSPTLPAGQTFVPLNTVLTWRASYVVANTFTTPITSVVLKDHFAASLAVDTSTITFSAPAASGASVPIFSTTTGEQPQWKFTWSVDTLQPGQTAILTVNVFTRLNPTGVQEFTQPGLQILNSGATLKWIPPSGIMNSTTTLPVFVMAGNTVGAITGIVTSNGVGVSGVTVSLSTGSTLVATSTTGNLGFYHFDVVAPGTYTVLATTSTGTASATVTVTAGAIATQNLST